MATLLTKSDVRELTGKYVRCKINKEDTLSEFISKVEETVVYNAESGYDYYIEMPSDVILKFTSNVNPQGIFSNNDKFNEFRSMVVSELVDVLYKYNKDLASNIESIIKERK